MSDRIGRRPMLLAIPALALFTACPAMSRLVTAPSFTKLLIVGLWFSRFARAMNRRALR